MQKHTHISIVGHDRAIVDEKYILICVYVYALNLKIHKI